MEQHDAARRELLEGGKHGGEIDPAGGPVEPGIGMHLEARPGKDGHMVLPGRIADPDRGVGEVALEEICAHLQRAGAAQRLDDGDASGTQRRMMFAKQQGLDGAAIGRQSLHRQIEAGLLQLALQPVSGQTDRLQLRNDGLLVIVQPDAEVNFVCPGILLKGFHQGQDRIARVGVNVLEHSGYS